MVTIDASLAPTRVGVRFPVRFWVVAPIMALWLTIQNMDKLNISIVATSQQYLADMGITNNPVAIGVALTVYGVPNAIALFVLWGPVVDRIGPRKTILISTLGWVVCSFAGGLTNSYPVLLGTRAALGIFEASYWPVFHKTLFNWFPIAEKGRGSAIQSVISLCLALVLGPLFTSWAVTLGGWRWGFFGVALLTAALILPLVFFFYTNRPDEHPLVSKTELDQFHKELENDLAATEAPKVAISLRSIFTNPYYWVAVLAFAATAAFQWGFNFAWLPTFVTQKLGASMLQMGGVVAALGFVGAFVGFGGAFFIDRIRSAWQISAIGGLAAAVAVGIAGVASTGGIALAALVVTYIAVGLATPTHYVFLQKIVSSRGGAVMGKAAGVHASFAVFVGAAAPPLMGALMVSGGFQAALLFCTGCLAVAGLCPLLVFSRKHY